MNTKRLALLSLVALLLLALPGSALAQTYSFSLDREVVNVFWNADGTQSIDYQFTFTNDTGVSPIDYVDVGVPNANYDLSSVTADVDGQVLSDISASQYVSPGVAVGLGRLAIPAGLSGNVHVVIERVERVLYPDSDDQSYASAVFVPTFFDSQSVHGSTSLSVTFHLPPGVQPNEPRYHIPENWPGAAEPQTGFDTEGRITYTWSSLQANGNSQYKFGASFPAKYIPDSAIVRVSVLAAIGTFLAALAPFAACGGFILFFALIVGLSAWSNSRRRLQYLPPKISIEGHGIKRGLTAIEAAVVMQKPLDQVLTMIMFAVIKKEAAKVVTRQPLTLEVVQPIPEGLQPYEREFLQAFLLPSEREKQRALQDLMIALIKSVSEKMKGFSRSETLAYYEDIIKRAWAQVQTAETPEVKSQKFDEVMDWTMLDRDFSRRSQDVFGGGPVFVPIWWGRYDPGFGRSTTAPSSSAPASFGGGGKVSMPQLPGANFAASIANSTQTFAAGILGNVTSFTSRITDKTNPVPPPSRTSSGGGFRGGGGCACACACAGCACACAGGGR
jgi:hypothetical protein